MGMRWKRILVCGLAVVAVMSAASCKNREKQAVDEPEKEKTVFLEKEDTEQVEMPLPQQQQPQPPQSPEERREAWVQERLDGMTLEEAAAQMFVLELDTFTGVQDTTEAGEITRQQFQAYPVGGILVMGNNIQSEEQIVNLNTQLDSLSRERIGLVPFLCVDEEGGTVTRIAGNPNFPVQNVGDMSLIGASGDPARAYEVGSRLGTYLSQYRFNVDFAPDADVLLNSENTVSASRSFGSDAELVAPMVAEAVRGLREQGICATVKHFPGHGATAEDSHEGFAYSLRTLEEVNACELKPFQAGIDSGAEFVMVGHLSYPNIAGNDVPASISEVLTGGLLRQDMQYDGIVITDAMNMGAIAENYSPAEAAVMAVQAGVDIILEPADFQEAYQALLGAVRDGTVKKERIDESVKRILRVKWRIQEEEEKQ